MRPPAFLFSHQSVPKSRLVTARNCGVIAPGNHWIYDSLRGAPPREKRFGATRRNAGDGVPYGVDNCLATIEGPATKPPPSLRGPPGPHPRVASLALWAIHLLAISTAAVGCAERSINMENPECTMSIGAFMPDTWYRRLPRLRLAMTVVIDGWSFWLGRAMIRGSRRGQCRTPYGDNAQRLEHHIQTFISNFHKCSSHKLYNPMKLSVIFAIFVEKWGGMRYTGTAGFGIVSKL